MPAIPWIEAAGALFGMAKSMQSPGMPRVLGYNRAQQLAEDRLNPLYENIDTQTLKNLDTSNMNRGFYGQLPGDVMKRATSGQLQNQRASDIANMAQQLVGQSQSNALATLQAKQNQLNSQVGNLYNMSNMFGNIANNLPNYSFMYGNAPTTTAPAADMVYTPPSMQNIGQQGVAPVKTEAPQTAMGVDLSQFDQYKLDTPTVGWDTNKIFGQGSNFFGPTIQDRWASAYSY